MITGTISSCIGTISLDVLFTFLATKLYVSHHILLSFTNIYIDPEFNEYLLATAKIVLTHLFKR